MRVLMLASYFPKPENPLMGNWALAQAQAIRRTGVEIEVVSGTSWVPSLLAVTPGAKAYAECPALHNWDGLVAHYPRWMMYSFRSLYHSLASNPGPQIKLAWWTVRRQLLGHVDRFKPDLVYAHHTQINGYLALQLKRLRGLPYVITDHDFGELNACLEFPKRRQFLTETVQHSSRMVAVASRMERITKEAFPTAKSLTVNNGTITPPAHIFERPRPASLVGAQVIFTACAFSTRKGIPLLVQAFREVAERYPRAVLRIAGDGAERPLIEKAILDGGLSSRVTLLGKLPHGQVLQEMAWSDIFALPGWDEPFATAFSEALSTGCPIVYASDGGITDVVKDGQHGLAVSPKDLPSLVTALDRLLGDPDLRTKMKKSARDLFETRLMWDHNAEQMKQLFSEAMEAV